MSRTSWRWISERVGRWQTQIILFILYVLLWIPVGIVSLFFTDWLHRRPPSRTNWWPRAMRLNKPDHVKEPF